MGPLCYLKMSGTKYPVTFRKELYLRLYTILISVFYKYGQKLTPLRHVLPEIQNILNTAYQEQPLFNISFQNIHL